jgi:hypothetical protein
MEMNITLFRRYTMQEIDKGRFKVLRVRGMGMGVCLLGAVLLLLFMTTGASAVQICSDCHNTGPHSQCDAGNCAACHGNPPTDATAGPNGLIHPYGSEPHPVASGSVTPGAHAKHATSSGMNYVCSTCHYGGMSAASERLIGLPPDGSYNGNGMLQIGFNIPYQTTSFLTGGTIPARTSPAWDTTSVPLACNTCHGYPPAYAQNSPKANSHLFEYHKQQTCNVCHYATTTSGTAIADITRHANGVYDLAADPAAVFQGKSVSFNYTYAVGGGTCSSVSCHPQGDPGYLYTWGNPRLSAFAYYTAGTSCYEVIFNRVDVINGTSPYTYTWAFGDGTSGTGLPVTHVYPTAGPYYPTVSGMDSNNHSFTGTVTGGVYPLPTNTAPTAAKSISVSRYTVTLTDLSYDPDYNTCGHSGTGTIQINWGTDKVQTAAINLTGSPSNQVYQYTFSTSGTKSIQHFITDNTGSKVNSAVQNVVLPGPISISGTVARANGTPVSGVTMILKRTTGTSLATNTTNAQGNYSFSRSWTDNCYLVQPSKTGMTFTPATLTVCDNTSSANFTAN